MSSTMDRKHVAIAAAAGAAAGIVIGTVGTILIPKVFKSNEESFRSGYGVVDTVPLAVSQKAVDLTWGVAAGDNRDTTDMAPCDARSNAEIIKTLEMLAARIASLENTVLNRMMLKSSTASSLAGYITANESEGSDDNDPDELLANYATKMNENSSGDEDIYFTSNSSVKASKQVAAASSKNVAAADSGTVDFTEIDICLSSDDPTDQTEGYAQLTSLLEKSPSLQDNPEFVWRLAKSTHQKTMSAPDQDTKKLHALRAKELAFQALSLPGGDKISDVHKWCGITIGNIGDFVSVQEKIQNAAIFKERIENAIRLNNQDEMSYHLLGRWCYSIYMMTWIERKVASTLVPDLPSATVDDAYTAFLASEQLKPGHWIDNQLFLAKCCIEKKDFAAAMDWLDRAVQLPLKHADEASKKEVINLIQKYSYYRRID